MGFSPHPEHAFVTSCSSKNSDRMNYTAEIAVLQSALFLVEKQTSQDNITLSHISKSECKKYLAIVEKAVEEIRDGLEEDNRPHMKNHWDFKLHAAVFLRVLSSGLVGGNVKENGLIPANDWKNNVIWPSDIMPAIGLPLYLELVKHCGWENLFLENLLLCASEKQILFLKAVLHHVREVPFCSEDLILVSSILELTCWLSFDLCDHWSVQAGEDQTHCFDSNAQNMQNSLMSEAWVLHDLVLLVSKIFSHDLNTGELSADSLSRSGQFNLKQREKLQGLLLFIGLVLCEVKSGEIENLYKVVHETSHEKPVKRVNPDKLVACWSETENSNELLKLKNLYLQLTAPEDEEKFCTHVNGTFVKSFVSVLDLEIWLESVSTFLQWESKFCTSKENEENELLQIFGKFSVNISHLVTLLLLGLRRTFNLSRLPDPDKDLSASVCQSVKEGLHLVIVFLETMQIKFQRQKNIVKSAAENMSLDDKLKKIENKLTDYNVYLLELLTCCDLDVWQNERFLTILELNEDLLSTGDCYSILWDRIDGLASQGAVSQQVIDRLVKVLLSTVSKLHHYLQDIFIADCYVSKHSGQHWRNGVDHVHRLTSVLNKVTGEDVFRLPLEISHLALLNPCLTLTNVIERAVRNRAQTPSMVKILQSFPTTCHAKHPVEHKDTSLLCYVLQRLLATETIKDNERKTLIQFICATVQLFQVSLMENIQISEMPLLDIPEFLLTSVFPHMHGPDQNSAVSKNFAVKLLHAIFQECEAKELSFDWPRLQPIVLLLSLCRFLHNCSDLWDEEEPNNVELKEILIESVSLWEKLFIKNREKISALSLQWLDEKTSQLDWTIRLRLRKILQLYSSPSDTQEMSSLADNFLNTLDFAGRVNTKDAVVSVLLFVSVDDETLNTMTTVFKGLSRFTQIVYESLLLAITEIIPNLLAEEWKRVARFLLCLVQKEQLIVSYRLDFFDKLPFVDFREVKGYLSLSQITLDVILLLLGTHSGSQLTVKAWKHIIHSLLSSIKDLVLSPICLSLPSALLLINQVFCHVCVMKTEVKAEAADEITVLLLETLTMHEEYTRQLTTGNADLEQSLGRIMQHIASFLPESQDRLLVERKLPDIS